MNLRDLLNKFDSIESGLLDEGFNYKAVAKQLGGITDVDQRHQAVAQLAVQNNLPGLYDPVDGKYVSNQNQVSSSADKDTDYVLAAKGLIPPNAQTSTFFGRLTGYTGDKYDQGLRGQSNEFVSAQEKEEFKQEKIGQLQDLMKQLMALKKIPSNQGATPAAAPAASNATANTTQGPPAGAPGGPATSGQSATPSNSGNDPDYASKLQQYMTGGRGAGIGFVPKPEDQAKATAARAKLGLTNESVSYSIANDLMESFGYVSEAGEAAAIPAGKSAVRQVVEPIAVGAGGGIASKAIEKATGKVIPLAGAAFGAYDAYKRGKEGDWLGAGIAGLSGAVSLIPGVGWIPAIALDAVNLGRDLAKDGGQGPTPSDTPPLTGNQHAQHIMKMQAELKAKGANLGTFGPKGDGIDGKVGKLTKIALGQHPDIAKKYGFGPVQESLADTMKSLQSRLRLIEDGEVPGAEGTTQPVPEPNTELNAMAQQMISAGGQIIKVDDHVLALMPDKTIVDPSTMEILDGSSSELTSTGQQYQLPGQEGASIAEGAAGEFFAGLKGLINAAKTGWHGAPVATGKLTKAGAPQMVGQDSKAFKKALSARPGREQAMYKGSKWARANPVKAGALATGTGLAVGYGGSKAVQGISNMIGGNDQPDQTGGGGGGGGGNVPNQKQDATPTLVCSPEQIALIGKIKGVMGELGDIAKTDKLVAQVIDNYNEKIAALDCGSSTGGQGATPSNDAEAKANRSDLTQQLDQITNNYRLGPKGEKIPVR